MISQILLTISCLACVQGGYRFGLVCNFLIACDWPNFHRKNVSCRQFNANENEAFKHIPDTPENALLYTKYTQLYA